MRATEHFDLLCETENRIEKSEKIIIKQKKN